MNKVKFLIEKTKTSLKYLGSTGVIISLSVMFSSICLMSLLSLSKTFSQQISSGTPREKVGGDAYLWLFSDDISAPLATLDAMKKEGTVNEYAYIRSSSGFYYIYSDTLKRYVDTYFITAKIYEDTKFPLKDTMKFSKEGINIKDLPKYPNGVIIADKFAEVLGLKVGDTINIAPENMFDKYELKIVGLLTEYAGSNSTIFVNKGSINTVDQSYTIYIDGDQAKIESKLQEFGPVKTVEAFAKAEKEGNKMMFALIRGLSIIGLFVGSFGIANSVNAIVKKRRREIGILKSIGFKKMDIMQMLLSEIFVISVGGSLLGIGLGYLFFYYLVDILTKSLPGSEVLLSKEFYLIEALLSFVVSIVSSILFAFISINRVAEIKPIYALKDLEIVEKIEQKGKNLLRLLVIGVIFCGISVFLTKSFKYGVGAVALVALGIVVFSFIFRFIFFLILKLPLKTRNEIELAWGNLKMNYKKVVLPMVAIFIGMFAVLFIGTLMYSSKKYYNEKYKRVESTDYNILVKRFAPKDKVLEEKVSSNGDVKKSTIFYRVPVKSSKDFRFQDVVADFNFYTVTDGRLDENVVLLPDSAKEMYELGSTVNVPYLGKDIVLTVGGFYDMQEDIVGNSVILEAQKFLPANIVIVSKSTFDRYFSEKFIQESWIAIDRKKIAEFTDSLSTIPDVFLFSEDNFEKMLNLAIDIMIKFTTSIASLALLAGIILIATVTILDVASKRRDFAIFKAIGFKQRKVTAMVVFEYSIMSVIISIFSISLVYIAVTIIRKFGKEKFDINGERIMFDLNGSLLWSAGIICLVMLIVYIVSRNSLKSKPSEVLRYE